MKNLNGKKLNICFITALVLDFLALLSLFFIYGPINYFRDLWVTTAMSTQSHQYLARIFYSEKTINEIMARNYLEQTGENTDASQIGDTKTVSYTSIYEEQILKRDENQDYKIIPVSGTNSMGTAYKGFVVAIYDPSRIELAVTNQLGVIGQKLTKMAKDNNAIVAINASGFEDPNEEGMGGSPEGVIIKNGKIIWNSRTKYVLSGFNYDNVLVVTSESPETAIKNGMKDAMQFGPALIVNGKSSIVKGNGGYGIQPRTVIAQRKDGIVLFVVIDGRQVGYSVGIDMSNLITLLENYGAYNAANMDGGASTTLVVDGQLYNKPCALSTTKDRWLPDGWIFK